MSKEIYILIGVCVFAFLIGGKLRKSLKPKNKPVKGKKNKHKVHKKPVSPAKEKQRKIFTIIMLTIVFGLLIFMIPALSRDLLTNGGVYSQNLILRILIVAFSIYILFTGFIKIRKTK
ncbi:hypothetical protein GCQ56_08535 [Marinifilum sp. N1E240]|uniref:hypothetical protein n=1 Tax=Marinifilum sp. N1E240 TaxID=2608082 RepID=UPI00128BEA0B|nr:hypothetical protein [Marinifilum sp. N1E240]MPQ47061.1 hypothetical protein [Marinifilum sp. N1E240]